MAAGGTLGHFTWCEDFSAARNASLALATGDWVLVIDADEELVIEDAAALRAALSRPEQGAYIFPIHNQKNDGSYQVQPMLRLFRRFPGVCFEGRLHEEIVHSLQTQNTQTSVLSGVYIRHDGYLTQAIAERDKWKRNLRIAIVEVEEQPESPKAWYNMGRSSLFSGQTGPAKDAFAQVARLLGLGQAMGEAPYCNYASLHRRLLIDEGRLAEAEELLDRGLERIPGFPEFHYERGLLRRDRGDVAGARADFTACLQPSSRYYTASIRPGIRDELPAAALAELDGAAQR